jgi:hypothetical protein
MDANEIKKQIRKYGKVAYIAVKDIPVQKKFDPINKELNLLLSGSNVSIFDKPLSLMGTVTHQQADDKWPSIEEKWCMPLLQIAKDMPIFKDLFGIDMELITIYCPQNPLFLEGDSGVAFKIKELATSDSIEKALMPKGVPQEKNAYSIKWKKIVDYPSLDLYDLFYPQKLIEAIELLEEEHDFEFCRENFPTSYHTKLGGYPHCLQHEPNLWIAQDDKNVLDWEFIMQLNQGSFEKLNLIDGGVLTIFRHKQTKEWRAELQFH